MREFSLLAVFWLLSMSSLYGQFTSVQDGNWHDGATWGNTSPGTEGVDFPGAGNDAVVFHNVSVTSPNQATVSGVFVGAGVTLTVNSGARLYFSGLLEIEDDGLGGNGFLVVNGTLRANQGSSTLNDGVFSVSISGLYEHNLTTSAGNLILADWLNNSECRIIGYTSNSSAPGNLGQSFHHFTWNCPNFVGSGGTTTFVSLGGALTTVDGDLTVSNTGGSSRTLRIFDTSSSNTLTIGGNLIVNGTGRLVLSSTGTSNVVNVTGNFSISNTASSIHTIASTGSATVNVTGAFSTSVSAGSVTLNMNSTGTPGTGIMNIGGNFTNGTSCTIARSGSGGGSAQINFNGSSIQSYSNSGSLTGAINFTIQNGSTVDLGTSAISGSGSFTLQAGGTIRVGSPDGLVTGSTLGNIRNTGSRTYQANGNIVYSGITQSLGNEWSSTGALNGIAVNLEVINGSAVTNNNIGSTSLVGVLTLTNGRLNIGGSNSLTIQGVFNSTASGFIGGSSTSNLTFSGSGAMGTLNMATGSESLNNLTIGRSGTLVLGTNLTVENSIALTFGNLNISGRTLTFNGGSISSASTGLISNSTSNLTIGGSTYSGSVPFTGAGNQMNNLTLNTTGGSFSLNSALTIVGTLFINNGTFSHVSGLTMGTGSTISRGGGSMSGAAAGATTNYNVTYTGDGTTGVELPSSSSLLNNLNIQASGTITLNKNITVNGNVDLASGTLAASTFNISLASTSGSWNKSGSASFNPETGTVIVTGGYSITGSDPNFGNLSVNSGASITLPSGNLDISGNLQVNAASTFNANNGTITLISGNNQTLSGGGKTFRNLTINKSGNGVSISTGVNLTGVLDIQSATTVAAGGNLTLVSNGSGTALIGEIFTGGSVTGNVISQRFVAGTGRDFRDISAPVLNPTVAQLISSGITITGNFTGTSFPCSGCATNNASFFFYDEAVAGAQTLGYTAHPPNGGNSTTSTLAAGRGYSLLVRDEVGSPTINLTGTINSGNISLPVSFTSTVGGTTEDGWNLVGNPYPSHIDWDVIAGWSKTNIQGNQISVWDPTKGGTGGYRVWNGSTGDLGSGRIALGQGFWVKASSASPALQINESAKTTTSTSFYRTNEKVESLELIVKNLVSGSEDNAFLQIQEGAESGIDSYDGFKKMSPIHNLTTLGEQSIPLSINVFSELPKKELIPLKLSEVEIGEFEISVNALGDIFSSVPVYLFDKQLYTEVDLKQGSYFFKVLESDLTGIEARFYIYFDEKARAGEPGTGIQLYPIPVDDQLNVVVNDPSIEPQMKLLDYVGRTSMNFELPHNSGVRRGSIDVSHLPSGLYFIKGIKAGSPVVVKFLKK